MKILIINKYLGPDILGSTDEKDRKSYNEFRKDNAMRTRRYNLALKARGHKVDVIRELSGSGADLENYDMVIAHPYHDSGHDDPKRLEAEVKRRGDFRVMITTVEPEDYGEFFCMDGPQVCSFWTMFPERMVEKVESDWGELPQT